MFNIWTELGFRGNPYDQAYLAGSAEGADLFCGRAAELLRVQVGIASGGTHVAIEGDAGVGKTSLAQVASYEMFRQAENEGTGSLFLPVPDALQLVHDAAEFERTVWRGIAGTLIANEPMIRRFGRDVPDFGGLAQWLNSPTAFAGGSVSVLGFGAAGNRVVNTSSGFSEGGFNSLVRRELSRVFPGSAAGGVVCVMDNLELLGESESARRALETIRGTLLELPSLRWVFVGSKGIITGARSARLSGFVDLPFHLSPLSADEAVELVQRRLDYWGTELAHAPVQAEDFRFLYLTMGQNLRDSLSIAQQFAKEYFVDFVSPGRQLPTADERPLYFQSWLADRADSYLAQVSDVSADAWRVFDRVWTSGGKVSVHSDDAEDLRRLGPLIDARLLELDSDRTATGQQVGTLTAYGWLCASARPRATGRPAVTKSGPALSQLASGTPRSSIDVDDAALPLMCRLIDLLGPDVLDPAGLAQRWIASAHSTVAEIGLSSDGPVAVDLQRDGPHGLVAGTTGSGKSDLLKTIIASLAIANRPDHLNFVLVDYKSGAAFAECVDLPHTVGLFTDLDSYLTERALASLSAELQRRQRQLSVADAAHFDEYVKRAATDTWLTPMPLLVIVIDEYASLAHELPEFVSGVIGIARLGRSLGVHLLLGTQRPAGVVSPEIRANTNLRICLRVDDAAESMDLIDVPDAALIDRRLPGRAFVRLAAGMLVPFQTAWSGRQGEEAGDTDGSGGSTDTDLSTLVESIRRATAILGVPPQRPPWLPALPSLVELSRLSVQIGPDSLETDELAIPFGLLDLPLEQRQAPLTFDLAGDGHLLVAGAPQSGRSQLLRTLAIAAAAQYGAGDLHLYGLDFGNGALLALADLPHTGAVVARTQTTRATRLIDWLSAECSRRLRQLAALGLTDVGEQRRAEHDRPLPRLLVLIDRWETFIATTGEFDGGRLTDAVLSLLRQGANVGIHLVVTGDRSVAAVPISSLSENKLALRLTNRFDYGLLGLHPRTLPDLIPSGRAFVARTGAAAQIAIIGADPSVRGQDAAITRTGAAMWRRDRDVRQERRATRFDT